MEDKTAKQTFPLTFEQLRILFISGCAINAILFFVPSAKVRMGFFATQERLLSTFDAVRLAFQMHQTGIGLLGIAFIAAMVVFLVLALKEPKRWVFIAGAAVSAFFILLDLFQPSSPDVENLLLPRLAGWIASVFILSGFWATPPEMAPQTQK